MWPLWSSDLNPCDFFFCGACWKQNICEQSALFGGSSWKYEAWNSALPIQQFWCVETFLQCEGYLEADGQSSLQDTSIK